MKTLYPLLAFLIGSIVPLQAAINNQLKLQIQDGAVFAIFVSFATGLLTISAVALLTQQKWANLAVLPHLPWWMFLGGVVGTAFVFSAAFLAPKLGVATMMSLIIAGQVSISLLFDRFGWFSMPLREINGMRLTGALLIIAGVILVNFGNKGWKN